jgi:hypothetical protein
MSKRELLRVFQSAFLLLVAFAVMSVRVKADIITDPQGDFLATYPGPHNGDLDVRGAEVRYDGTNFYLHAILDGPVGFTPGGIYVLGFNRGAGTAGFQTSLGLSGVVFDTVIVLPNTDTITSTGITVTHSGNELFAVIPASLPALVSTGFSPVDYTWNLWPRNPPAVPTGAPGVNAITDFAPDNSMQRVTPVPAPASLPLMGVGAIALSAVRWKRRKRTVTV